MANKESASVKYELNPQYEYGDLFYFNKQQIVNEVWYQRLGGHLNCKVVDFLKENKLIFNKIKNCESICKNCDSSYAAKFCRLPFLLVDRNCDYQLARIHCDLWGLTTKVNERRIGPKWIKWPKWIELDQNKRSRPK